MINWVVVDPVRCAKGESTVCATYEHHVGPGVEAGWLDTRHHVNVIVSGAAGTVHGQERLPFQSTWIDRVAEIQTAAEVDLGDSVKSRCDVRILCVA